MNAKKHRIFIAINLPPDVKKQLASYQQKWPEIPAKWTSPENLHITLEFLGDLTDEEMGDVCIIAKEVAKNHNCFSVDLLKVLYGPEHKMPPRMVWAEGEKSEELADLKNDLQECLLEKISFKPESRSFSPHITLARISEWQFKQIEPEERPEVDEYINLNFFVESIEVMESVLKHASRSPRVGAGQGGRCGPVYEVLESCELKN